MNIELPQATTGIEWCDHTANAWWGCTKVHAGCANCYAEGLSKRTGHDVWGKDAPRRVIRSVWNNLHKWNEQWAGKDRRGVVFCSSMCDVFEDHDGPVIDHKDRPALTLDYATNAAVDDMKPLTIAALRRRLLYTVKRRDNLVHLLLTKRPENVMKMVPDDWHKAWPTNVMIGTSPCDQATADKCIPALLRIPGPKFLSVEPLLNPINFRQIPDEWDRPSGHGSATLLGDLDWVIIGCESRGQHTGRLPAAPDHERQVLRWYGIAGDIVEQCHNAGVPAFIKQIPGGDGKVKHELPDFPVGLRVRQRPAMLTERGAP